MSGVEKLNPYLQWQVVNTQGLKLKTILKASRITCCSEIWKHQSCEIARRVE